MTQIERKVTLLAHTKLSEVFRDMDGVSEVLD